jgi:hypothetical protein
VFGLGELGRQLHLLTGRDYEVVARGPDFVVDEQLELNRFFDDARPPPCVGIHADQGQSAFPCQAGSTLAPQEKGIAKTDIEFDVNSG